jgi:DNA-binding NtrC family response regulator
MVDLVLQGRRLLVVEDDYILALDLCRQLAKAGAEVIGPMSSVAKALGAIKAGTRLDAALLDVNVRNEQVFPVAEALAARQVPFLFMTGYDRATLPERYRHQPHCEKPVNMAAMLGLLDVALKA